MLFMSNHQCSKSYKQLFNLCCLCRIINVVNHISSFSIYAVSIKNLYKKSINHVSSSSIYAVYVEVGRINMYTFINFLDEEDGIGVVELILILVVLIGLVLIFKDSLRKLVKDIFDTITKNATEVSNTD